jgi:hypothetical protein
MVSGIEDTAKEFGKTIGGQAALALISWLQRLWDAKGVAQKEQFENFVEPCFNEFKKIYDEYENSFKDYRNALSSTESEQDIHKVIEKIEGDLRFTARSRIDLLSHLKNFSDSTFGGFVRSIADFLVSNESSLSGSAEDSLSPPEIVTQVMRRGLIDDLKAVMAPWAAALDPGASAPPIQGTDLEHKLESMGQLYGIKKGDPNRDEKLRAKLAVEHLDARTEIMLSGYKRVREEYDKLKGVLLTR